MPPVMPSRYGAQPTTTPPPTPPRLRRAFRLRVAERASGVEVARRERDELGTPVDAHFRRYVGDMPFHGPGGQVEALGDQRVRQSFRQQRHHLMLPGGDTEPAQRDR